jgi:hypothetical protein
MSEILKKFKEPGRRVWWLPLDCGHWYKWTGPAKPPRVGAELDCPACGLPKPSVGP